MNVECKKAGVDTYRRVKRDKFALLLDTLMPLLHARELAGTIELAFDDRLPGTAEQRSAVATAIMAGIAAGQAQVIFPGGEARVQLTRSTRQPITQRERDRAWAQLRDGKSPKAYAYLSAPQQTMGFAEPIAVLCQSRGVDTVIRSMRERLSDASRKQLDATQPGMLAYFIPEIEDFAGLDQEGGLKALTDDLFRSESRHHVVAIAFLSDYRAVQTSFGEQVSAPMLTLFNGNSLFPNVRQLLESSATVAR